MTTHEQLRCCGESKIAGGMNSSLDFCGVVLTASKAHASTSLHLHRASRPLYLHTSTSAYLTARLRTPRPPCLDVCTPATPPALQPPYLHVCTPAARLRASELYSSSDLYLHAGTPAACFQRSMPPYLHVDTTAVRLQHSIPPYIPPRRDTYIESIDLRLHTIQGASRALELHTSMLPHLHDYSEITELHTSMLPRPHTCSPPSTSQHLQNGSRPPFLHTRGTSSDPYLNTSISLHLHRASSTPDLQTSVPSRRYICIEPPDLHISTSARLRRGSRAAEL